MFIYAVKVTNKHTTLLTYSTVLFNIFNYVLMIITTVAFV